MREHYSATEQKQIIELFKALLRVNTTNPPGNEAEAVQLIEKILDAEGIETKVIESAPGRANLIAKLEGSGSEPPLLLISHLDVVAADEQEWSYPPFAAEEHNGVIYGRGALDTKQLTVMELTAFLALKRSGQALTRDVLFIATADEEQGSIHGMKYLIDQYSDLLPTGVVINEGGGFYVPYKDKPFVIYTTGEKGSCTVRLYASGQSGHAACPPDDLAMRKMAAAIARISEYQFPAYLTHVSEWFIQSLGLDPRKPAEELVREVSEWHDDMMLRLLNYNLFSEIHIHSFQVGEKVNVIPYQAEVLIEFRTLPHLQMSDIEQLLTTLLKDTGVTWEIEAYEQGFECDITHDIVRSFKTRMAQRGVDAEILPIFALGRTDGRFLGRFGANVYGFSPLYTDITFTEVLKKVHNHDESLSIQSLLFGTNVITDVLMDICFTKDERSDRNGLHD